MSQIELSETTLKRLFKEALTEAFREQRALLHETLAEVLEDLALAEAVRAGQQTEIVSRETVFESLESYGDL
ncbi:MAG: hypothetical protein OXD47_10180 [Gammaproteobacteria bacterium]|nr:hypothetical protein [Gammaproteobacteria bacterium]MCY4339151.1 hypothetical protein [Gammaproteobacteria bacterium]